MLICGYQDTDQFHKIQCSARELNSGRKNGNHPRYNYTSGMLVRLKIRWNIKK